MQFFQAAAVSILLYGCTTWTLNVWRKSLMAITQERCELYCTSPGGNAQQSSSCMATYHPSRTLSKLDEPDMQDLLEKQGRTHKWCTPVDPFSRTSKRLDDQLEPVYSSSVPIQDAFSKTSRKRWTIAMGSERGSGRSVLHVTYGNTGQLFRPY